RKQKSARRPLAPACEGRLLGQAIEAVVQLDGVEHSGVVLEPLRGRQLRRIEPPPPALVLPARTPDANPSPRFARHSLSSFAAGANPIPVHPRGHAEFSTIRWTGPGLWKSDGTRVAAVSNATSRSHSTPQYLLVWSVR